MEGGVGVSGFLLGFVEGIDTLETHYDRTSHQPDALANTATDRLLELLGFQAVTWGPTHGRVTGVANDGVEGYILARDTGPYGRPISFVFSGAAPEADGSSTYLSPPRMKQSVNFKLLQEGHAYPLFYHTLFWDLREPMADAVHAARSADSGLWPQDRSNRATTVRQLSDIEDRNPMFPKLFRRLVKVLKASGNISGIEQATSDERVEIIEHCHHTHFDNVLKVNGEKIRLTQKPEGLIFGSVIG